jgi:CBS domain containing-hemolysin-like protein
MYGYLDFQNKQLREVMWPREDILYYDLNQPLSKLIHLFVDQEITRLPVCDESLDHVIGILDAYQFFKHQHRFNKPQDLIPFLYKPFYVPETTTAKTLLKLLDQHRYELSLVVNEYGTLVGLIAREDLVELVIGQVKDLRDSSQLYSVAGDNEVIASAKWELSDLNDYFKTNLESPNHMTTVGGWLMEQMGEIPKTGAKYQSDSLFFQVLQAFPNRITRIYIRKIKPKGKRKK